MSALFDATLSIHCCILISNIRESGVLFKIIDV